MTFLAPAKINLSLIVEGKRADGFHEIETVILPIGLCDRLIIERLSASGAFEFTCDDPSVPADETNLVVRAVRVFCERAQVSPALRIKLEKSIPHGAGLGGGSSDAATTLLALDEIFGTGLPREMMLSMAAELGSDVPVFLLRQAAVCGGRGERVAPIEFSQVLPLLLIKPPFPVPTAWAYAHWRNSREIPSVAYGAQHFQWGELRNDLERPVFEKYLFLALLKGWLLRQPEAAGALMSGSGSTMFAVLHEKAGGAALAERVTAEFGDLWCCATETVASNEPVVV